MSIFLDKKSKVAEFIDKPAIRSAVVEIAKAKEVEPVFDENLTIEQLAGFLGVETADLLLVINEKNGTLPSLLANHPELAPKTAKKERPDWLDKAEMVDLDVREYIAKGQDPFGIIMKAVSGLGEKILHLINIFEPAPLYSVLGRKGFDHYAIQKEGIWHIYFYNTGIKEQPAEGSSIFKPHQKQELEGFTIDVRGLEPPEPMVKILESLEKLPEGEILTVHHFRRPKHLYPRLAEKGYTVQTDQIADDHIVLKIHK